jgi:hypothetical protein
MVFDMRTDDTPAPLRGAYSNLGSIRISTLSVNGEMGFHSAKLFKARENLRAHRGKISPYLEGFRQPMKV